MEKESRNKNVFIRKVIKGLIMDWKIIDYRYMNYTEIGEWKKKVPVLLYHNGAVLEWTYSIPYSKMKKGWVYHRDDGPARKWCFKKREDWIWYGRIAHSEEEFYDPSWRKKVEIKKFL